RAGRWSTCFASLLEIEQGLVDADLVIGAVLVHGAKAPRLVTHAQLETLKPGAVLVDVSIDQHRARLQRLQLRVRDQAGCLRTVDEHGSDHQIGVYEALLDLEQGREAGRPAPGA